MWARSFSTAVVLAALALGVITAPALAVKKVRSAPPSTAPTGTFSCTASALRVTTAPLFLLPGSTIEPIVANPKDEPCVDDSTGLVGPIVAGRVTINGVAIARTDATPAGGHAESYVTNASVALGPGITGEVLSSSTDVSCVNGQPSFSSSGEVVNVAVGGTVVQIPANQGTVTIDIPLVGTLYLNQVVTTPTSITRRALFLDTALVDVVIAESKSNVEGNPCGATPPPPPAECSDGVDNDGDKLIDADDPGCIGPDGVYNPNDDDESDTKPTQPQCSDGMDNDGDKAIDSGDPGCHTDGDVKNSDSYDPNDDDESK